MSNFLNSEPKLSWVNSDEVRPYIFLRRENAIHAPHTAHKLNWFSQDPLMLDPFKMQNVEFANQILRMEGAAFASSGMPMPRWVFYDCALMPGFVCGFAVKASSANEKLKQVVQVGGQEEWVPISLFIIIPTIKSGEWVAHNLCSVNSLLDEKQRYYGLGFLTKAFGLWYANVETCCGMTQWGNSSVKLHSHYGDFEILTAYSPIHSHPKTLTYRLKVHTREWEKFFTKKSAPDAKKRFQPTDIQVDPNSVDSMIQLQQRLEKGEGPYYLDANQVRSAQLEAKLTIHRATH